MTVSGTQSVTRMETEGAALVRRGALISSTSLGTSRCARGPRGIDRLTEVVRQPLPSASPNGLGQPLHLHSLLVPSAKWR